MAGQQTEIIIMQTRQQQLQCVLWRLVADADAVPARVEEEHTATSIREQLQPYASILADAAPQLRWPHFEACDNTTTTTTTAHVVIPEKALKLGEHRELPAILWVTMLASIITSNGSGAAMTARLLLSHLVKDLGVAVNEEYRSRDVGSRRAEADELRVTPLVFTAYMHHLWYPFSDTNVRALLELGADPNLLLNRHFVYCPPHQRDPRDYQTPLAYVLHTHETLEGARLLMEFGARLNPSTDAGVLSGICTHWDAITSHQMLEKVRFIRDMPESMLQGLQHTTSQRNGRGSPVMHCLLRNYVNRSEPQHDDVRDTKEAMHIVHTELGVSMFTQGQTAVEYAMHLRDVTLNEKKRQRIRVLLYTVLLPMQRAEEDAARLHADRMALTATLSLRYWGVRGAHLHRDVQLQILSRLPWGAPLDICPRARVMQP